jgi:hypothetical protein
VVSVRLGFGAKKRVTWARAPHQIWDWLQKHVVRLGHQNVLRSGAGQPRSTSV